MTSKPLGFIYILTNPGIPGLVKIGQSGGDPDLRARDLHSTGVPTPFVVEYKALYEDYIELERRIHDRLDARRPAKNREFFNISVADAILFIREAARMAPKFEDVRYVSEEVLQRRVKAKNAKEVAANLRRKKNNFQNDAFISASLAASAGKRRFSMKASDQGVRVGHRKGGDIPALRGWVLLGQHRSYSIRKAMILGDRTYYHDSEPYVYWKMGLDSLRREKRKIFLTARVEMMVSESCRRPEPCVSLKSGDFVECELIGEPFERFMKILDDVKDCGLNLQSNKLIKVCFTAGSSGLNPTYEGIVSDDELTDFPVTSEI